jgi:hypothetical protein
MVEVTKGNAIGIYAITFTNKLTKQLAQCDFNIKKSVPGLYPTMRELIVCFSDFGIEVHNYTDEQDRRFQRALLSLTKEFTEFLGTLHQVQGADKKELLVMLSIDIYKTEVEKSKALSQQQKELLQSEILITIFEEILSKTIVAVLMFKDIVNEEFSRKEFRSCMSRWFCCGCRKKKKYLK